MDEGKKNVPMEKEGSKAFMWFHATSANGSVM